ncbi:hypothetical protein C1645_828095 [Glomus cerebriforme]|uniref:Uncharacterized protein n=1 Tax=Glomus cerebriforme TaxID=658196 RepID=A0A397SRH7_9GLOM|nr:hypothetical protein C1645_828095 [Glomus cerebriforme]
MEKRNNEIFEKKCQRCRRDDENWIREIKGNTIKVNEDRRAMERKNNVNINEKIYNIP